MYSTRSLHVYRCSQVHRHKCYAGSSHAAVHARSECYMHAAVSTHTKPLHTGGRGAAVSMTEPELQRYCPTSGYLPNTLAQQGLVGTHTETLQATQHCWPASTLVLGLLKPRSCVQRRLQHRPLSKVSAQDTFTCVTCPLLRLQRSASGKDD